MFWEVLMNGDNVKEQRVEPTSGLEQDKAEHQATIRIVYDRHGREVEAGIGVHA